MATKKISALTELELIRPNDYIPIVDASSGTTKRVLLNSFVQPAYFADPDETDHGAVGSGRSLKDLIDAIGSYQATIVFTHHDENANSTTTYTLTTNETVSSNIQLVFQNGAQIDGAGTLTVYSPENIKAHERQQIFGDSLTVAWSQGGVVNQQWWGVTDAALVDGVASLSADCTWYLPADTYTQTTKITLPVGVNMKGDGYDHTFISSTIADNAIELTQTSEEMEQIIEGFKLIAGDGAVGASSTGTGGLTLIGCNYVTVRDVYVEGFQTSGWGTAGNPATELRHGFMDDAGVGNRFINCHTRRNDIGFYADKAAAQLGTNSYYRDCTARLNRTHGYKLHSIYNAIIDGGVIESNNGLYSVYLSGEAGYAVGPVNIKNVHFEENQRISGAAAVGSREIFATAAQNGVVNVSGCGFVAGTTYPEKNIELKDVFQGVLSHNKLGGGANTLFSISLDSDCRGITIIGGSIPDGIEDNAPGTTVLGVDGVWAIGDATALTGATPYVSNATYVKLTGGTITDLMAVASQELMGQIIIGEAQSGTALSGANFLLKGGGDYMRMADGSIIWLRRDVTSDKWVCIGHEPSVALLTLSDGATQTIDDRSAYLVPDACTTAILSLTKGWPGQVITFMSSHTGANTTQFTDTAIGTGTNKMALNGNFTMGQGDQITLIYNLGEAMWIEVSRAQP